MSTALDRQGYATDWLLPPVAHSASVRLAARALLFTDLSRDAARLLQRMACETGIFDPSDLPLPGPQPTTACPLKPQPGDSR